MNLSVSKCPAQSAATARLLAQSKESIKNAFTERFWMYADAFGASYDCLNLPDRLTHTIRLDGANARFIAIGMNISDRDCSFVNWLEEGQSPHQDYWFHGRPQYDGLIDVVDGSRLHLHGDAVYLQSYFSRVAIGLLDDDLANKVLDTVLPAVDDLPKKTRQYLTQHYSS